MINPDSKILVTGAHGFLGKAVIKQLVDFCLKQDMPNVGLLRPTRAQLDLLDKEDVKCFLTREQPDIVIHLAGSVGGIGLNKEEPGRLTYENLMMGLNLIEECRRHNIKKFVCIGTTCSYAANCPIPFRETDFIEFNATGPGMPEITNAGYGIGKRVLFEVLRNYRKQYGFKSIYLIPVNLCGPNDHFDERKSHVIPALIKRFHEAKTNDAPEVVIWGTGKPTREFLYVDDCAKAIVEATARYDEEEPLNIGNGVEISIGDLAKKIASVVGYTGTLRFDATKPDGQMRRCMDITKMKEKLGDLCKTDIDTALKNTYDWYLENGVP